MYSSQKRKRDYNSTPQLNRSFQVLGSHDPWQRVSNREDPSLLSHQSTPRTSRTEVDNSQPKILSSPRPASSSRGHDQSKSIHVGGLKGIDIPSKQTKGQSRAISSSNPTLKHLNMKDKNKYQPHSHFSSSPFVPDATSTPQESQKTEPTPILVPVDPRMNDDYIKAQQMAVRQRALETKADQTFASHISSSTSSSDTSGSGSSTEVDSSEDEDSDMEEKDSSPSPKPKKSKHKKTESKKPTRDTGLSGKYAAKEKKKSRKGLKNSVELLTNDMAKKKKSRSDRKKEKTTRSSPSISAPTTKQTNQTLESHLFTSLTNIIPLRLMSHARTTLASEVQSKAKTSHTAVPYPGNRSGPSDRAVTLRAAHDLLVCLSTQKVVANPLTANMESDLARIATERGKRIEMLEMENRGLKGQLGRVMIKIEGESSDNEAEKGERRAKKKRRKN